MPFKDQPLVIVDVETTGSKSQQDRIIEIGLLRIERGRLVKSFQTLLNPEQPIPAHITRLTGITNEEVATSPTFAQASHQVKDLLEGCLFVAHNASFDYGFVKNEFRRMGEAFNAQTLCSVKLSRKLFPEHRRHNLGELIRRYGLDSQARHRALDDAKAVWEFLQKVQDSLDEERLKDVWQQLTRQPILPQGINIKSFDEIPEGYGVYIFYDPHNNPIYVGKAAHLREKMKGYFDGHLGEGKRAQMLAMLKRVDITPYLGELSMKLLQQFLITTLKPVYNLSTRFSPDEMTPKRWPFRGAVMIEEKDVFEDKSYVFVVQDWTVLKAIINEGDDTRIFFKAEGIFDPATAKILHAYLKSNPYQVKEIR